MPFSKNAYAYNTYDEETDSCDIYEEITQSIGINKIKQQVLWSVGDKEDLLNELWLVKKELELSGTPIEEIHAQLKAHANKFLKRDRKKSLIEEIETEKEFCAYENYEENKLIRALDGENEKEDEYEITKNQKIESFLQTAKEALEKHVKSEKTRTKYFKLLSETVEYYTDDSNSRKSIVELTKIIQEKLKIERTARTTLSTVINKILDFIENKDKKPTLDLTTENVSLTKKKDQKEKNTVPFTHLDKKIEKDNIKNSTSHLILLAKNETGYKDLVKLPVIAYTENFYYKAKTNETNIPLVATNDCHYLNKENSVDNDDWILKFIEQNKEKLVSKFLGQYSGFLKNRAVIDKGDIINSVYLYILEHKSINQSNAVEKINKLKLKDLNLTYDSKELFFDMNSDQDSLNENLNLVSRNNPEYLLINEEVNEDDADDIKNINYIKLSESIGKVQTNQEEQSGSGIDEYEKQIIKLFGKMTETQRKYWAWWFEYRAEQTNKATQTGFTRFVNKKLDTNRRRQSIIGTLQKCLEFAGVINKKLSKAELQKIQSRIPMQEFIANLEESAKYPIYKPNTNKEFKRTAKILVFADYLLEQSNKNSDSIKQQGFANLNESNKVKTTNKSAKILSFTTTIGKNKASLDKITSQTQAGQHSHNSYLSITNKDNLLKFPNLKTITKKNHSSGGNKQSQQPQQRNQAFEISNALFIRSKISQLEPVFRDGFA